MQAFLTAVAAGMSMKAAAAHVGIHYGTYERWRRESREFRSQLDVIRMAQFEERGAAAAKWDGDFITGRKIFFGFDTYWHQREIVHTIEAAAPGEVVLILVAPETGKTTLLEDYMALDLGRNPNMRFTYATESQVRTRKICGRLQRRMTNIAEYERFIREFGPFHVPGQERQGKPWAADFMTVYRADHDERDYSFEGRGWRSAVAGTRTDRLLVDDVQSLRSLNQTKEIVSTLRQDFFSRPGRTGKIVIVMTRVGIGDVPEELWEQGIVTEKNTVRLPIMDDEGKSLCPELWPEEDLEKRRLIVGEDAWWRNYMQKPRYSMDASFTDAMVDGAWDDHRGLGSSPFKDRIAMLDPALSGGNALMVAAYGEDRMDLLDIDYRFNVARVEDIILGIDRAAELYGFQDLIIEINAYQRGLVEDERLREVARRHGFRIHPHQTHNNKNDADLGVARMATAFIRSEIRFPGDDGGRERFHALKEQLLNWRPDVPTRKRTQDLVMALWFGWLFWQRRRKTMGSAVTTLTTGHRMPYTPTSITRTQHGRAPRLLRRR